MRADLAREVLCRERATGQAIGKPQVGGLVQDLRSDKSKGHAQDGCCLFLRLCVAGHARWSSFQTMIVFLESFNHDASTFLDGSRRPIRFPGKVGKRK